MLLHVQVSTANTTNLGPSSALGGAAVSPGNLPTLLSYLTAILFVSIEAFSVRGASALQMVEAGRWLRSQVLLCW